MTTQNESNAAGQIDHSSKVEEIAKRVDAPAEQWNAETKDQVIEDRKILLQFVRKQAAQLKSVRRLADESVHRISVDDLIAALEQPLEDSE